MDYDFLPDRLESRIEGIIVFAPINTGSLMASRNITMEPDYLTEEEIGEYYGKILQEKPPGNGGVTI